MVSFKFVIRWLIPALAVSMLVAGACRGSSSDESVSDLPDKGNESTVQGVSLTPFDGSDYDPAEGLMAPSATGTSEGWRFPVIADTDSLALADAFGASSVPYFVFIEADGTVAFRLSGNLGPAQLVAAMKRLAGTSI